MESLSKYRNTNIGHEAPAQKLVRGLGWLGVGLGLTELTAPRVLAALIGIEPRRGTAATLRALGARELVSSLGALFRPRRSGPIWARVAGDALHLGLLAWAARSRRVSGRRVSAALLAVAGTTALDIYVGRKLSSAPSAPARPTIFSVTIAKPPAEVYAFYRKLENLPLFMDYLESVTELGAGRSRWVAKFPTGGTVEWEAEITEDRPGERIAWRTIEGSRFPNRGQVTFARTPGGYDTEVRVEMEVGLPGLAPSAALAKLLTRPQIKGDLRRLKQVMETGEVLFSDASAHRGKHPAQPSPEGTWRASTRSAKSRLAVEKGIES